MYPKTEDDWLALYGSSSLEDNAVVPLPSDVVRQGVDAMIAFVRKHVNADVAECQFNIEWADLTDGTRELQGNWLNEEILEAMSESSFGGVLQS